MQTADQFEIVPTDGEDQISVKNISYFVGIWNAPVQTGVRGAVFPISMDKFSSFFGYRPVESLNGRAADSIEFKTLTVQSRALRVENDILAGRLAEAQKELGDCYRRIADLAANLNQEQQNLAATRKYLEETQAALLAAQSNYEATYKRMTQISMELESVNKIFEEMKADLAGKTFKLIEEETKYLLAKSQLELLEKQIEAGRADLQATIANGDFLRDQFDRATTDWAADKAALDLAKRDILLLQEENRLLRERLQKQKKGKKSK